MWLLPSRGRPERALRLAETRPGDKPVTLWLSQDDPQLANYLREKWPWEVHVGPAGLRLAQILRLFYRENPHLPYYGFLGDDVVPNRPDWGSPLVEAAGEWYFAYPDDGHWGEKLSPHFCVGGELVREVGWLVVPHVLHSYMDTAWWLVAKMLGVARYTPEVLFEHVHPLVNKAEVDDTYLRGQETIEWDKEVYLRWRARDLPQLVTRVRKRLRLENMELEAPVSV